MHAYLFPGQGSQFAGMAKDLYTQQPAVRQLLDRADSLLGFCITRIMFEGPEEQLKETVVTQPAVFLHSMALLHVAGNQFKPDMVAGHSLGEFSALVASRVLTFEDGLRLVQRRAQAMQEACSMVPSTMAAIVGLEDAVVEQICAAFEDVIPANYNCPGQVVISGSVEGVEKASIRFKEAGARMVIPLKVAGAFHSPFMEPARKKLEQAIRDTPFSKAICPVYQNVDALPHIDPQDIRDNLIRQLTAPVYWTQTIRNMLQHGATSFTEVGPGKVLQGLVKKVDPTAQTASFQS
ncbi:MAG: malonyl CoA-acyl carrier protein transacylase [Chitinophagales bacterium]|nr:MAG: malonyl CoA-acyl carrier protein transacylase [Chitinophagales bacterium]